MTITERIVVYALAFVVASILTTVEAAAFALWLAGLLRLSVGVMPGESQS